MLVIISDVDLSKPPKGGIPVYLSQFLRHTSQETILIGKNKDNGHYPKAKCYGISGSSTNYAYLRKLFSMNKSFISASSVLVAQRPDFLSPFLNLPNRKIVTLHGNPSQLIYRKKGFITGLIYSLIEKRSLRMADKIIFVDANTAQNYFERDPKLKKKGVIIPPGVDTDHFRSVGKLQARKSLGLSREKPILLYVGRLVPEKNINKIIDAFKEQVDEGQLLVVGDGIEYQKIQGMTGTSVKLYSNVRHEKIPLFMNAADALVLMSSAEGLPTVVIEAFSCGTPVLNNGVGDLMQLVKHGRTGYICEFGNLGFYFRKLLKTNMTTNCQEAVVPYSWKKIVSLLEAAYR